MKNLIILILAAGGLLFWQVRTWVYQPIPLKEPAFVIIDKGIGSGAVAQRLADSGIVSRPFLFKLASRFFGLDKKLKAGEYRFSGAVSMYDVIQKMSKGDVFYRKITLAEGLTSKQMLETIAAEDLLSGKISLSVTDGEMLPETYSFTRGDSKDSIILRAKKAMGDALQQAWNSRDDKLPLKNPNDLLVLASIIEKETAVDEERRLVASVFVNRLTKGMRLQTDPTVIYALTNGQTELNRQLTRKDLLIDSPYNTYKYYGLPPSAICNPGRASLEAAGNPEISPYLYFVANGNGGHNFATSLKEHNTNVQNWKNSQK